jgi:hypothetical protein
LDLGTQAARGIELFYRGENFVFNTDLPDLALTEIDRFKLFLGDKNLQVFPISYKALANTDILGTLDGIFAI